MEDSYTIPVTVTGLLTTTQSMTIGEIEGEIVLKEGTGRIFMNKGGRYAGVIRQGNYFSELNNISFPQRAHLAIL